MSDKSAHHTIAEEVLKKISPTVRKRLNLTVKGSYTIVEDESGWVARITQRVVEFNKKRIEPKALTEAGMKEKGKDDHHRLHSIGFVAAPASGDGKGQAKEAKAPKGPGAEVVAKAVGAAAKPVPVKKAPAKKAEGKGKAAKGKKDEGNSAEFEAELAAEAAMNS
jgi:hypothetical protein